MLQSSLPPPRKKNTRKKTAIVIFHSILRIEKLICNKKSCQFDIKKRNQMCNLETENRNSKQNKQNRMVQFSKEKKWARTVQHIGILNIYIL